MSYSSTLDNPPNPVQAYAGSKPGQEFFRNLAETLNAAHKYNDLHIFSQGFADLGTSQQPAFQVSGTNIVDYDIIEIKAPRISRLHKNFRVVFRGRHAQSGTSSGRIYVRIYNGDSTTTVWHTAYATLSNSATAVAGVLDVTPSTISGNTVIQDVATIEIGLSCTAGASYLYDVALSWSPLSNYIGTRSPEGIIIPVGTTPTTADEPISAMLGYAFGTTANTLQKRKHGYFGACGLNLPGYGTGGQKYIMPFVRPHIMRVQKSNQPLTINYNVKVENSGSSAKSFRIQALDLHSLFESRQVSNYFSSSGDRSEFVEHEVNAGTTTNVTGTIDISPPFQEFRNIADGHFIALAVATRAMAPRAMMRYNDGSDFDDDLKIISYNFWGE